MCKKGETFEPSVLKGLFSSNPSPQSSVIYAEEEAQRSKEPEVMDDAQETVSSRHHGTDAQGAPRDCGKAQDPHRFKSDSIPKLRGKGGVRSSL